jgi:hypothetical protein
MKSIFVTIIMILIFSIANAQQIGDCRVGSSSIDVFDSNGSYACSINLKSGAELSGFSSSIVVITEGSSANVFNCKGQFLSSISLRTGAYVKNVVGNTVLIKDGSMTNVFDSKGNFLRSN